MNEEQLDALAEQQIKNNEDQANVTMNELLRSLHPEYATYMDKGYLKAVLRMNDDARAKLRKDLEETYGD